MAKRFFKLILGLFLYALGITITIKANIGYAPWDVFHGGLAGTINVSLGNAIIIASFAILMLAVILGEKVGLGTLLNMFLIGFFIDLIMAVNLVPLSQSFFLGVFMMILGLFVIALASYFYIGAGMGAGPRDSLMVGLRKKTGLPIGISRIIVELTAALIGWRLGGLLGIGTVISAFSIGFCVQVTFKLLGFDTSHVKHESLKDSIKILQRT